MGEFFFSGFRVCLDPGPKTHQKRRKKKRYNNVQKTVKKRFWAGRGILHTCSNTLKKRSENGTKTVPGNAEKTSPENVTNTIRKKTRERDTQNKKKKKKKVSSFIPLLFFFFFFFARPC